MDLNIVPLSRANWEQVRAIYLEGIADGNATFETEAPAWEQWDDSHLSIGRLIARRGESVLGWAALSPISKRKVYSGVAEVSLYVSAKFQGQGVGKALLRAVIAEAELHGIWTLQGGTFPENIASLRLQASCGFRIVGRRERIGCLHGVWRDTILTERRSRVVRATGRNQPS